MYIDILETKVSAKSLRDILLGVQRVKERLIFKYQGAVRVQRCNSEASNMPSKRVGEEQCAASTHISIGLGATSSNPVGGHGPKCFIHRIIYSSFTYYKVSGSPARIYFDAKILS